MTNANALRTRILAARDAQTLEEIIEKSRAIHENLRSLDQLRRSQTIFAYVSFRSEVDTTGLIDELLAAGKKVAVPVTRVKDKRLDVISITSREKDLVPGYCRIPEPRRELWQTAVVTDEEIEIILLPGSVFDLRGGRFGYGGGYYDRFLERNPQALRIGLAFDLQVVEHAPLAAHDQLLDLVVTESRIIVGRRSDLCLD
jgi:5-formyltetrahydrofolate cyclo-ligase